MASRDGRRDRRSAVLAKMALHATWHGPACGSPQRFLRFALAIDFTK